MAYPRTMLAHRIIPCLDVHAGRVVKGVNFVDLVDAGDPVSIAEAYDAAGADELVFLDITASHEQREITYEMVRQVAERCFMPFTVGGGIRTLEDVTRLIQAGAEKVSLNTAAVSDPQIVSATSRRFGTCATVVNIDPKRVLIDEALPRLRERYGSDFEPTLVTRADGSECALEVHIHGGRTPTGIDALVYARQVVERGCGEIILTSMDADGTRDGYDVVATGLIADAVDVPVVASGGCGNPGHMVEVLQATRADAVLAASIFHFGDYTIAQAKAELAAAGLPVRPLVADSPR